MRNSCVTSARIQKTAAFSSCAREGNHHFLVYKYGDLSRCTLLLLIEQLTFCEINILICSLEKEPIVKKLKKLKIYLILRIQGMLVTVAFRSGKSACQH